jgi:hypothetical protein
VGLQPPRAVSQTHPFEARAAGGPAAEQAPSASRAPEESRPLFGYAVIVATFGSVFSSALAAAARGHELPERVDGRDVVVVGLATHKLSRLIAKDKVTSPLRAPFTTFERESGAGEVEEKPRGRGIRKALGELVLCPFCLSQWIAAAFAVGLIAAPRLTRLLAGMWAAQAVGDAAQLGFAAAKKRS